MVDHVAVMIATLTFCLAIVAIARLRPRSGMARIASKADRALYIVVGFYAPVLLGMSMLKVAGPTYARVLVALAVLSTLASCYVLVLCGLPRRRE